MNLKWLCEPEKIPGLSRNRPVVSLFALFGLKYETLWPEKVRKSAGITRTDSLEQGFPSPPFFFYIVWLIKSLYSTCMAKKFHANLTIASKELLNNYTIIHCCTFSSEGTVS